MANIGKPPSVGWWMTGEHTLRWWDGRRWSWACIDTDKMKEVEVYGNRIDENPRGIQWFPRPDWWPERSRT
jgi:hypothetical protein